MEPQVFVGIDVGKSQHHATAVNQEGGVVHDKPLPQSEPKIQELLTDLVAKHGELLVVVDQPKTIGALVVAVAQQMDTQVAYLPGLTMRRVADLHPGQAKTDARDAYIIAETARTMPHTLRSITVAEEQIAELSMLCGFDDDLAAQLTQVRNRLRGLLTQIHPALERVLGPRLAHPAVVDLLGRYPTPAGLKRAGRGHVRARLKKLAPRMAARLTDEIFRALAEQTTIVTGTHAAEHIIGRLAAQLQQLTQQRSDVEAEILLVVDAHPLTEVLTSMPGVGVRTAARILTEVVGKDFKSAAHLASYAGIAPVTRQSGTSIRGESPSRRGNKVLKRVLFLSAFASIKGDPVSRAYYDRKRAEGKRHNQAIIALARRRSDVLFAMLRDGTFYESRPTQLATAA
ncbi:IS110 family transposase [Enteractinococcus coprophilus]|uniref:Transposase IS116/IS110/IS902 family protein n=1 Tax=Enteractinococcus coprophilus TaxID=1027633 RepID=A0A543AP41_9MICC|nr:IS110 family transposase [Enteractinococcus coprophilus]TQL74342.1 transposase IS116/IS110/IS902 family protein [Enteractinococcus coprophilus]